MSLKAQGLYKTYHSPSKVEVLKGVSLELSAGSSLAIMGRSGEGKSTLLHVLGTLEQPCSGELEICGIQATAKTTPLLRSEYIGFIFQAFHLLEECSVLENVLMPARIARRAVHSTSLAYQRAHELLALTQLQERALFPVKLLSGGEKQRLCIARALCNDPQLLLADEPSGSLDSLHSQVVHDLLLSCTKQLGKTLLIVTHDKELASLCDNILILKEGLLCTS